MYFIIIILTLIKKCEYKYKAHCDVVIVKSKYKLKLLLFKILLITQNYLIICIFLKQNISKIRNRFLNLKTKK